MIQLKSGERFRIYIDTIEKCGVFLQNLSDEEIKHNIFEESDIGVISFLHNNNLDLFEKEGMIDKEIFDKSYMLRDKVMTL